MHKIGSLFDGSGGFPLAASLCGIEPTWASEVEPYPIAVTRSRFPDMVHLGSVSEVNGAKVEPCDVLTFGSPCQSLSVAGKREGIRHETLGDEEATASGLFMEAVRIIKEMREKTNGRKPTFVVWENVPGAFSSTGGADLRTVFEELIKIVEPTAVMPEIPKGGWAYADCYVGDGFSIAYRVFDAQYIRTAQRRRRIYLVFDLRGGRAKEILFKRESLRGYFTPCKETQEEAASNVRGCSFADDREGATGVDFYNQALEGDVSSTLGESCRTATGRCGVLTFHLTQDPIPNDKVCPCLSSGNPDHGQACVGVVYAARGNGDGKKVSACAIALEPGIAAREGGHIYEGVCGTLRANAGDNQMSVAYSVENHPNDSRVNLDESGKVQTLTKRMGTGGGNVPLVMEKKVIACNSKQQSLNISEDKSNTLGANDYKEPQIIALDRASYQSNVGALCARDYKGVGCQYVNEDKLIVEQLGPGAECYQMASDGDVAGTLDASYYKGPGMRSGIERTYVASCTTADKPQYIVRRLTPTECARLQGFPDKWGHIKPAEDFTDREWSFWCKVRNTHAKLNGKKVKFYSKTQMINWYNKLHTDSAEYKMWGNGIALPCALYVMEGIADALNEEKDEEC